MHIRPAALLALILTWSAVAHGFGRGTFFVADDGDTIVRISAVSGSQRSVPKDAFVAVSDLAVDPRGDLAVVDAGNYRARDGVLSVVRRNSGARSVLAERDVLFDPAFVEVDSKGRIFTAGTEQDLLRFSSDGSKSVELLDTSQLQVRGLAVDSERRALLLVIDRDDVRLLRIDPKTRKVETVSKNDQLVDPRGLTIDCRDRVYTLDRERRIVRVGTGNGRQKIVAEDDFDGVADLAVDHLGDILLSDRAGGEGRIRRLDTPTGEIQVVSAGDLLDDPASISIDPPRREEDPDYVCGSSFDHRADEFLNLSGEDIHDQRRVDLVLRLGAGAWDARIDDELHIEGIADTVSDGKLVLTLDVPSQERLMLWLEDRMSDLRGQKTRLRERLDGSGPSLEFKVKLNDKRTRAKVRLRVRLEANTEPEILPVRFGLDSAGSIDNLPPLPVKDEGSGSGGGSGGGSAGGGQPGNGDNPGTGENPPPQG